MRTEISTLFELPEAPRRAKDTHTQPIPIGGASTSLRTNISAPILSTPSVPVAPKAKSENLDPTKPGRAQRVFKNITELGESSLFDGPAPSAKPAPAPEPPEVIEVIPTIDAPALDAPTIDETPFYDVPDDLFAPEIEVEAEPDSLRARLREKLAQDKLAQAHAQEDEDASTRTTILPDVPQNGSSQLILKPAREESAPTVFTTRDAQGPWELRVDALRYDPVDPDGLALLLKSGIWADALELLTESGHWIPLSRHPVYPAVRQILLLQTQKIVAQVSTGDWPREVALPPMDAPTPHAPVRSAPAPAPALTAAPMAPKVSQRPSLIAAVIALLTGILIGLVGYGFYRHFRSPETSVNPTNGAAAAIAAPPKTPILTVSMPSESGDMSGAIAMANARSRVTRAHDAIRFSQGLIAAQKPKIARKVLLNAMMADGIRPDLKDAFNHAIAADPALHAAALTLGVDTPIHQISPLGGGRSVSLKITLPDAKLASFKPAQDEWGQGWRGELAAYLFCEMVPCHFVSPTNRAARISRTHFEAYYATGQRDWRASYAERFSAIQWTREAGPDGVVREYMYGTLEDWVPHFVEWPIEYSEVYQDLLDIRFNPDDLNIPYAELVAPLETLAGGQFHASLLADQGDATVRDIARQISSLLVFDYLSQNWDRFSGTEKYYGVNNQFAQGKFISIDNGAAFYDEDVTKLVGPRFELTSRFSRSMVTAIRALDPAVVNEVLFPNANLNARRRLQLFWRQRTQMLKRVDALVEKYGEDRVYEFD